MRSIIASFLILTWTLIAPAAAEPPHVVASIKPIHSLVAAVMDGVAAPELLVPGGASPHVYSLKPSDARRLETAGLVFWVGPIYESFLAKPLRSLAGGATVVTLAETDGIRVLRARRGGSWGAHAHVVDHEHDAHAPDAGEIHDSDDGHLWLDPDNAQAIVGAAVQALAAADPENSERYRRNGQRVKRDLAELDRRLQAQLAPVAARPFIVFHDAYQYLERRYGLTVTGSITVAPEQKPGARRMREIRQAIERSGAVCVFAERQFESSVVRTIAADTKVRGAVLDPLGANLADGPRHYFEMMENLAASLATCLSEPPS